MSVNRQVRDAINRIEPLRFSSGPNFYTVDVGGWGLSAPTKPQLSKMLWDWFNDERPLMAWVWDEMFGAEQTGAMKTGENPCQ